jgi:hypothetical protein
VEAAEKPSAVGLLPLKSMPVETAEANARQPGQRLPAFAGERARVLARSSSVQARSLATDSETR